MGELDHEVAAICRAEGVDLGAAMAAGGYALAFVPHSARYITQEMPRHIAPWQWRRDRD